jgi:hypothetical protein
MTRLVRFSNNAVSRLAANLSSSGLTVSLTPGDGSKFPALTGSQYFMATLVKTDGTSEVVKVTARSTDTLTIVRAVESVGGSSTAYAFSAGDRIEMRLTAGALGGELDRLDAASITGALNKNSNYTITAADVTSLVRVDTSGGNVTITLPEISTLTQDFDVIVAKVASGGNNVLINRTGSTDLINGATSYTIFNQWQSAWLIADRSTNTWTVISSGISAVNTVADSGVGAGSATITLSGDPGSKNNVALFIGGVYQQKATFSLSGTTITAGGTIAAGVVWEAVWSAPLTVGTPSDGTVTTAKLADGALAATVAGLAKMADGFLQATTAGLAKMADGFLAATTAGRAKMADGFITTAKMAAGAATGAALGADVVQTTGAQSIAGIKTFTDQPVLPQKLTSGTAISTTSGTAVDFTSIPSWVKRVTVMFKDISTNGASPWILQAGAGSVLTSGYSGAALSASSSTPTTTANSTGIRLVGGAPAATQSFCGTVVLDQIATNTWVAAVSIAESTVPYGVTGAAAFILSGALDRIRLTTVGGTDTFDAGSVNILYE